MAIPIRRVPLGVAKCHRLPPALLYGHAAAPSQQLGLPGRTHINRRTRETLHFLTPVVDWVTQHARNLEWLGCSCEMRSERSVCAPTLMAVKLAVITAWPTQPQTRLQLIRSRRPIARKVASFQEDRIRAIASGRSLWMVSALRSIDACGVVAVNHNVTPRHANSAVARTAKIAHCSATIAADRPSAVVSEGSP